MTVKRVCSWCGLVLDEGYGRHAAIVTHSICTDCMVTIDVEIATADRLRHGHETFPCPGCPCEGTPYKMRANGNRRRLYIRCSGCGLTWITERVTPAQTPLNAAPSP